MVEPARPDRNIGLAGPPDGTLRITLLQGAEHALPNRARIGHRVRLHGGPIGFTGHPALVADPANVGPCIGEDHRVGLELLYHSPIPRPVINLPLAVRTLTVGPVEPDFLNRSVAGEQLGELVAIEIVVAGRIAIGGMVAIPGRKVESHLESLGPARVGELAHHVTLAIPPGAGCYRVLRGAAGPEAKAVVVLGGEDQGAEASRFGHPGPLPGIQGRGREDGGIFPPIAPFPIGEGVDPKVEKERQFIALPLELGRRGYRASGLRPRSRAGSPRRTKQGQHRSTRGEKASPGDQKHFRTSVASAALEAIALARFHERRPSRSVRTPPASPMMGTRHAESQELSRASTITS